MKNVLHLKKLTFGICTVFSITHFLLSKGQSSNMLGSLLLLQHR
jgi:hypothetical protein